MMKYGFLNPPLGLCYLSASLKRAGHQALVLDCEAQGLNITKIFEIVRQEKPDLIGITATSPELANALTIAAELKAKLSIPIVFGGVHVTIFKDQLLRENPAVDFGVVGEGEETIVELLEALDQPQKFPSIQGLIFRDKDEIRQNPLRPLDSKPGRAAISGPERSSPGSLFPQCPLGGIPDYRSLYVLPGVPLSLYLLRH